ncbi:MAG: cysteine dioxygenase family protein [Pseudomonadota bacterium]
MTQSTVHKAAQDDTRKLKRDAAIKHTITAIKARLADGVTEGGLKAAEAELKALCARRDLFTWADFPLPPENGPNERTFLIHEDPDGGYALYVNAGRPGQQTSPHDHGGSWAIVAAVTGEETHWTYREGPAGLEETGQVTVAPGRAIALGPQGIHAIHAPGPEPLLHLHLYGLAFSCQGRRKVYDLAAGTHRAFKLEDVGFVEDAR